MLPTNFLYTGFLLPLSRALDFLQVQVQDWKSRTLEMFELQLNPISLLLFLAVRIARGALEVTFGIRILIIVPYGSSRFLGYLKFP